MDESREAEKAKERRYLDLLPIAYLCAVLEKGGKPTALSVGRHAKAMAEYGDDKKSVAYRVGMSGIIPCVIVGVDIETTSFGKERYNITYRTIGRSEDEQIPTPLLSDNRLGGLTKYIWDRFDDAGRNYWIGKRMKLYKHNDPPKDGDKMHPMGYRCCVYAEPLE